MQEPVDRRITGGQQNGMVAAGREGALVDDGGRLCVPARDTGVVGWPPGTELRMVVGPDRVEIMPSIHELGRLYIEPTTRCNLSCRTCVRQNWREPIGDLDVAVFDRLMGQLAGFRILRSAMFGGFGEPTVHPDLLHMVSAVKSHGLRAEMTTNGTLLGREMLDGLLEAGLDTLWVSFDGAAPSCYENIRNGADFGGVVQNLLNLQQMQQGSRHKIEVGIAFVAMRSNLADLGQLPGLARAVGATRVCVSNVLPYYWEMQADMLCNMVLSAGKPAAKPAAIAINLPYLDVNEETKEPLMSLLRSGADLSVLGRQVGAAGRQCRFINDRCTFVRWDGAVAPCMGLLHSHVAYTRRTQAERTVKAFSLGNVCTGDLLDIWQSSEYRKFRERVDAFDFSPCSSCGGCQYSETNEADCIGNTYPTCGGCLWARGVIQCP